MRTFEKCGEGKRNSDRWRKDDMVQSKERSCSRKRRVRDTRVGTKNARRYGQTRIYNTFNLQIWGFYFANR